MQRLSNVWRTIFTKRGLNSNLKATYCVYDALLAYDKLYSQVEIRTEN